MPHTHTYIVYCAIAVSLFFQAVKAVDVDGIIALHIICIYVFVYTSIAYIVLWVAPKVLADLYTILVLLFGNNIRYFSCSESAES